VSFVPEILILLAVCLVVLSIVAAIVPARGAAGRNIVIALGHA